MSFDLAVVIPIYNEEECIYRTLSSFFPKNYENIIAILVDNNSKDNTIIEIEKWKKDHPQQACKILTEKTKGAAIARLTGMRYAKSIASCIVSVDADNWLETDYFSHLYKNFFLKKNVQVWRGILYHPKEDRLLKQLFIKEYLDFLSWQEHIEEKIFGPTFFGGHFGIKSEVFDEKIFNIKNIPLMSEATCFWSRHCYYLNYKTINSTTYLRTSSRRFLSDPYGNIVGKRTKTIRLNDFTKAEKIEVFTDLKNNMTKVIDFRKKYFSEKLAYLLLDAIFFEKENGETIKSKTAIAKMTNKFGVEEKYFLEINNLDFKKAKLLTNKYLVPFLRKRIDIYWDEYKDTIVNNK